MASNHTRSISLPSPLHPINIQFEEQLCRLKSSESTSTSSSSELTYKLNGLTELYGLVDELLRLPSTQQSLFQIQAMLDASLTLIDICTTSRDVLQLSKQHLQSIQSVLRRRCSSEVSITSEVAEYFKIRRTAKKTIKTCLKNIKNNSCESDRFLNDVEEITGDVFASLLSYIGGTKSLSRSVFAKMIQKKESSAVNTSEFDVVDATLETLVQKKTGVSIENIMNKMVTLESEIEEFDEVLECLFRHLVKPEPLFSIFLATN